MAAMTGDQLPAGEGLVDALLAKPARLEDRFEKTRDSLGRLEKSLGIITRPLLRVVRREEGA